MGANVFSGTKQEIADYLCRIGGELHEATVLVGEAAPMEFAVEMANAKDIFAEMRPFTIDVQVVDDSREVIYSRMAPELPEPKDHRNRGGCEA